MHVPIIYIMLDFLIDELQWEKKVNSVAGNRDYFFLCNETKSLQPLHFARIVPNVAFHIYFIDDYRKSPK